jgi:metallo-beta-lactamase class B
LFAIRIAIVAVAAVAAQSTSALRPDPAQKCSTCDEWNRPLEPFRVFGNTYYVGVDGLSAVLVTSDAGHVLLDGALAQSAPLIDGNIRKLGFKTEDIRLILNSHAHFDHAAGIPALQRVSGATVAASESGARALEQGFPTPDDPQYESGTKLKFAPTRNVRVFSDGEVLRVGPLAITAHLTPGHTPGSTTFTWRSCEGATCVNVVYADSLNAVSDDNGFRFTGDGRRPSLIDSFRRSIALVERLPCDVLLTVHPGFAALSDKAARHKKNPGINPFIETNACRTYAADSRKRLEARVASEKGAPRRD